MKVKRLLTQKQFSRFKLICGVYAATLLFAFLSDHVASEIIQQYQGDYVWQGEKYSQLIRRISDVGYIDEYTQDGQKFCHR